MGNKNSQQFHRKGDFLYKINLSELDIKVDLQGLQFQASQYNILQQRFKPKPMMDKNVRDSQFCFVDYPQLSQTSRKNILKYLSQISADCQFPQNVSKWRMTKYNQGGHFTQHCDRQKQLEDVIHFGTQIWLPPKNTIDYQGGQLILNCKGNQVQIPACPQLWTHIILPLGLPHKVRKVLKGFRISFVKQIWIKEIEHQIQTDQDRKRRQEINQIYRLHQIQRQRQRRQWIQRSMRNRRKMPPGYCD